MFKDFGIDMDVRVMTDATTGKAIASRKGLGKLRHAATHELWVHDLVLKGQIQTMKTKNNFNTSDCFTKHLSKELMDEAISQFQHKWEDRRSETEPELSGVQEDKVEVGAGSRGHAAKFGDNWYGQCLKKVLSMGAC